MSFARREGPMEVRPDQLVMPLFVREGLREPEPIGSMPGQFRWPVDRVPALAKTVRGRGLAGVIIFGLPAKKDLTGHRAADPSGVTNQAVKSLKDSVPELTVITDVCLCSALEHGHCGITTASGGLDVTATQAVLAEIAAVHAEAGADWVAPSSMVVGQVGAVRAAIPAETGLLAYTAKFASNFYGPFREAADSAPAYGDRRGYQHDPANLPQVSQEIAEDIAEGADILMVKPALAYLDIVRLARESTDLPVAAYNVSGEYAMVKAAAAHGWIDERKVVLEALLGMRRAGADLILTYHALDVAEWLG